MSLVSGLTAPIMAVLILANALAVVWVGEARLALVLASRLVEQDKVDLAVRSALYEAREHLAYASEEQHGTHRDVHFLDINGRSCVLDCTVEHVAPAGSVKEPEPRLPAASEPHLLMTVSIVCDGSLAATAIMEREGRKIDVRAFSVARVPQDPGKQRFYQH